MRNFYRATPLAFAYLLFCAVFTGSAQTTEPLKLTDFAVWGGSASANSYNSSQGVFIGNAVIIQGNVGSNHRVDVQNLFSITGNIYSGNIASFGNIGKVTGNIFAAKTANNYSGTVISGDYKLNFVGNLTAKGKIVLKKLTGSNASTITGKVAVPAPTTTNYTGPTPAGGFTNTLAFPVLPAMPNNANFDNQAGTKNISGTETISPGKFKKLSLSGNKTVTFNGPGNYIFTEVDNGSNANKIIFDFKGTSAGTINIFVIKDAKWGRITVSTKNGNHPGRIYTEVHGSGSSNSGFAFSLVGPLSVPSGSNVWLGNVWAPNGGISVKSLNVFNAPHIIGALWSAKKVELDQNLKLVYQAAAVGTGPTFIDPYYAPPTNGKVSTANNKIGPELAALASNPAPITSIPDNEIFITDNSSRVMIEVVSKDPNDATLRTQLITLGMVDANGVAGTVDNGPHIYTITGFFPIARLSQLTGNTRIEYVRPLYPPISNSGIVTSQGDVTMRSNAVRSRFGLDGTGVKIGVISDSYNAKQGAQTDVNEGDLPGVKASGTPNENPTPVQVVADLTDRGSDEGRAMLQIVHDVAPKAKLAFHTGFLSAGQFAKAIQTLASPTLAGGKCDVIVDDLTYITEPFQRDGVVAQAVNQAVQQGVTYFSSAGNFGNKSYEAVFTGVTNTSLIPTGQIHRFGAGAADIFQTINLKPGTYTIGLQWSDEFSSLGSITGVQTDMDLYLLDGNGLQLFGFNRSNLFGDPFEVCAFTVKQETNAKLMIVRASGNVNVRFKYVIFRGEGTILDYQTGTSSIVGHPNADSAIAVGAMLYENVPGVTPIWPGVASFSSRGGTFTRQNSGASFLQRNKPELIGPNGVNTTVNLGGVFNDGDTYPNFFGTSAAAPHVAAVGALIIQGRKKYNLQTTVAPWQVRQQLVTSTGKFSYLPGNFSYEGGYGYVQADSAIQQIANARPIVSSLEAVNPGSENGNQPFAVRMQGKYFTPGTQIYLNNAPVATTVSIDAATGIGTATATIPAIPLGQDPIFQLYNPPKSSSGEDGGLSEGLQFFRSGIKILVKADNKSRRYGQENPNLTSSVSVVIGTDTSDISLTSLTLAELKLTDLTLATNATTFSNPRSYGISIARTTPLENDDPLLEQYEFVFLAGTLSIEKMPLKITPVAKALKYGDDLSGITYNYELDQNGVVSPGLVEEVKSIHKKYLVENGLIVLHGFSNASPLTYLDNMSTLSSFQALKNARKFLLDNGVLKPIPQSIPLSRIADQRFVVDVSAQSLETYKQTPERAQMIEALNNQHAKALLNVKALTRGDAEASVSGGNFVPMVNGQLMAMVNGQLRALVNGQLRALVNNQLVVVNDIAFQDGKLRAFDGNSIWHEVPSGQMVVDINGQQATVDLSVVNGQLRALVNGQEMTPVGNELQATVNGQLLAVANGQLRAIVNGQIAPLVNSQITAIVNGELQPLSNGQLRAIVNGQLLASIDGQLEMVQDIIIGEDGELQAVVNGQLRAIVNGQLRALVNGVLEDVPTSSVTLVNGQLRALVNGEPVAYVNGQLRALVNGQLRPLVNGSAIAVESVTELANGQLRAIANGINIPIANGQLEAFVDGHLLAMVNGQLMAVVNGEVTFVVFQNDQLEAIINGQLRPLVNGQLRALVNGQLQEVNNYTITNGQLRAIVNGETWVYPNGQLKALVNGQLRPLVNNFDVSGTNNNANTMVLVDEDDINLQAGDLGGMFSMNMITSLDAGYQYLIPAAFVNENFEVTYGLGEVQIYKKPLTISADDKTKNAGQPNPALTLNYGEFAYDDSPQTLCQPVIYPGATVIIDQNERRSTFTDVRLTGSSYVNDTANVYVAQPGETLTLTGNLNSVHHLSVFPGYVAYCPGCITQVYIGLTNNDFTGNQYDVCFDFGSGTGTQDRTLNSTFTAPTRPGVYYITQKTSWYFSCYQFGHLLHDQIAKEAIAVVIVKPTDGVTANTTATTSSAAGEYPIVIGGCYFGPNYRIVFDDGVLTVNPGIEESASFLDRNSEIIRRESKLYPNPAANVIRLILEQDVEKITDIQVYDGTGRLQLASSKKQAEGYYDINVANLRPGIYLVKARTAGGTKTFKFMKR